MQCKHWLTLLTCIPASKMRFTSHFMQGPSGTASVVDAYYSTLRPTINRLLRYDAHQEAAGSMAYELQHLRRDTYTDNAVSVTLAT